MNKVSIKAVIIGSITDILTSNLLTLPFFIYVAKAHNLGALPEDQISSAFLNTLQSEPALLATQWLLGAFASVLGGYVAAQIAERHQVLNGALASFLCVGGGLYGLFFGAATAPLWQHLAALIASPVLAAMGGYLKLKKISYATNRQ